MNVPFRCHVLPFVCLLPRGCFFPWGSACLARESVPLGATPHLLEGVVSGPSPEEQPAQP